MVQSTILHVGENQNRTGIFPDSKLELSRPSERPEHRNKTGANRFERDSQPKHDKTQLLNDEQRCVYLQHAQQIHQ